MTLGAFISSATAGFMAAKLGRKTCLWLASVLCCASTVTMMATTSVEALYCRSFPRRARQRVLHDLLPAVHPGDHPEQVPRSLPDGVPILHIDRRSTTSSAPLTPARILISVSQGALVGTIADWATAPRPDRSSYLIPLRLVYAVPLVMAGVTTQAASGSMFIISRSRGTCPLGDAWWAESPRPWQRTRSTSFPWPR